MTIGVCFVNASTVDIFDVAIKYGESVSCQNVDDFESEYEVEIVDEGSSIGDVILSYVDESKITNNKVEDNSYSQSGTSDSNGNNSNNSNNSSSNNSSSNNSTSNGDYSSVFGNAKDYRDILLSIKDTSLNKWSAINRAYDKYDDKKEDNITIIATAYTSAAEENGGWEGMNAIGGKLGPGCIAAPKDIPFQSKIRINGLGVFNVEDRGGAIKRISNDIIRIDIWMNSYNEAMKFGRRIYNGRII